MEEKEIYEVISPSLNGYAYIHDFKTDNVLNTYDSCDLLNQQSKRIKELEEENLSLQEQSIRDNQNWIEETTQLKQQLHDLPKKIVEDIEKNFTEYLPLKYKTGAGFYSRLNTILKKYGGEDE